MFKAVWGLFKLSVLALVLALIFHNFAARFLLIAALRAELGVPVEVERANLDLLNTRVVFEDIKIKNPEGFPREALALISRLEIDFEVSSWRELKFHLDEMRIECDEIRLVERSNGQINFMAMKIFDPSRSEKAGEGGKYFLLHRVDFSLNRLSYAKADDPHFPVLNLNVGLRHVLFEDAGNLQSLFRKIYQELVKSLGPESLNATPAQKGWNWSHGTGGWFEKNPPPAAAAQL